MAQEINLTEVQLPSPAGSREWKGNVILFPGGAYEWHSPREGMPVARRFAAAGWKPWILYYPVCPPGEVTPPLGLLPLRHAAAAVKRVRLSCPGLPVAVCGFSAGGHAAAALGVHWEDEAVFPPKEQPLIRPDAMILGYPVITAGPWAHRESIEKLLKGSGLKEGANPDESNSDESIPDESYFSLENHVTFRTPPAFLWHTAADEMVPVQNSLLFAERLAAADVPFELHIYPCGVHGLSLATAEVEEPAKKRFPDPHVADWFRQCVGWLDILFAKTENPC